MDRKYIVDNIVCNTTKTFKDQKTIGEYKETLLCVDSKESAIKMRDEVFPILEKEIKCKEELLRDLEPSGCYEAAYSHGEMYEHLKYEINEMLKAISEFESKWLFS